LTATPERAEPNPAHLGKEPPQARIVAGDGYSRFNSGYDPERWTPIAGQLGTPTAKRTTSTGVTQILNWKTGPTVPFILTTDSQEEESTRARVKTKQTITKALVLLVDPRHLTDANV
jgi:hypothetical protein